MFKNLKIKTKIAIIIGLLIFLNTLIVGFMSYNSAQKSLQESTFGQLTSVRSIKRNALLSYFNTIKNFALAVSFDKTFIDGMRDFGAAYQSMPVDDKSVEYTKAFDNVKNYYGSTVSSKITELSGKSSDASSLIPKTAKGILLQNEYCANNPNPIGSKSELQKGTSDNIYDKTHALYHPYIASIAGNMSFITDLYLVDMEGNTVYTYSKDIDFGTNLNNGPFANSNIAKAYKECIGAGSDKVALTDFAEYQGAYSLPAAFISTPLYEGNTQTGVLIFQLFMGDLNKIMTGNKKWAEEGLGETGETYLVGPDGKLRTTSRSFEENPEDYYKVLLENNYGNEVVEDIKSAKTPVMVQELKTDAVKQVLSGKSGDILTNDYRDMPVLSSFEAIDVLGLKWGILSERDQAEAFAPIATLRNTVIMVGLIVLVIAIIVSVFIANSISRPIISLVEKIKVVATGDLTVNIESKTKDEVGQASGAMKGLVEKLRDIIGVVITSSDNITSTSVQMSSSAQQLSQGATEQASSVEEISASMEEMAANIQQNTNNSKQTEKIASHAAKDVEDSNQAVLKTVSSMKTIASKISIIGEISRQTNLLALNAAVEAARAGEHGKGFAVVAAEVRKLAERSQLAASEIDELSAASVSIAQNSGELLSNVVPNIQKTSDLVQEISASSIEQNSGAQQVNSAIQQLNQVVQENAATAEEMAAGAEELTAQAEQFRDVISFFKVETDSKIEKSHKVSVSQKHPAQTTLAKKVQADLSKKETSDVKIKLAVADDVDKEYQKF
jgi:methyl-accepting chemotaxis protein